MKIKIFVIKLCLLKTLKYYNLINIKNLKKNTIDADLECIIEKIDRCTNNPENPSTIKVSEHIPSGFSMSTISSFRSIENKHNVYRVYLKDCMEKFFDSVIFVEKNLK